MTLWRTFSVRLSRMWRAISPPPFSDSAASRRNTAPPWQLTTRRVWSTNRKCLRSSARRPTRSPPTAALKGALCDAAREYVRLAHLQYRAGSINYIDVLDAQRRYFDAQIGLSNAVRDEHLALVGLYKALGGGWQTGAE